MKFVLCAVAVTLLALSVPMMAEACPTTKQWAERDIAFADVIFEGSIADVKEIPSNKIANRLGYFEFTFDIHKVVRGELQQDQIVVGWIGGRSRNSPELTLEFLIKEFGETTRVAISTPQLANKFCELKPRLGNFYDEDKGAYVSGERMRPFCNAPVSSLAPAFEENIPFVLSNSYVCGYSYFFPVQKYEDMQNYVKNIRTYEQARETLLEQPLPRPEKFTELRELRRKIVPQGPLPWKYDSRTPRGLAINLVRHHHVFFKPELKTNVSLQNSLADFSIAVARDKSGTRPAWFDRNEAELVRSRENLKREILRLLDYMEKDPGFRDRLLLED